MAYNEFAYFYDEFNGEIGKLVVSHGVTPLPRFP